MRLLNQSCLGGFELFKVIGLQRLYQGAFQDSMQPHKCQLFCTARDFKSSLIIEVSQQFEEDERFIVPELDSDRLFAHGSLKLSFEPAG